MPKRTFGAIEQNCKFNSFFSLRNFHVIFLSHYLLHLFSFCKAGLAGTPSKKVVRIETQPIEFEDSEENGKTPSPNRTRNGM